jgi:hypothetical protein
VLLSYVKIDDACQGVAGNFVNTETGEITNARCKKWSCKSCGPRKARRFVARVLRTPRFTYFVTLTAKPHGEYLDAATVRRFNGSWRSWRQWLKREAGVGDVTWVLERGGKSGHLHRHALIETGRSFSYKKARAALVRCGMGAVCDFKPIKVAQSAAAGARYLGKYLGKSLADHQTDFPRYARRAQTSSPDIRLPCPVFLFVPADKINYKLHIGPVDSSRQSDRDPAASYIDGWLATRYSSELALNQKEKVRHGVAENVHETVRIAGRDP